MAEHIDGQILLYSGLALLGLGVIAGVIALVALTFVHRRLDKQLTQEYSDKRR